MKKMCIQAFLFFIIGSVGFSYDEVEGLVDQEMVTVEEILSQRTKVENENIYTSNKELSKSDSFLISLGMNDSLLVVGGEGKETKEGTGVANSVVTNVSSYGIIMGQTVQSHTK